MKQSIEVSDLVEPQFKLIETLPHIELIEFIKKAYKPRNWVFYFYNGISLIFGGFIALIALRKFLPFEWFNVEGALSYLFYGIFIAFLLIPLHELIHMMAYKHVGAKKTSFDMNLKKFYFMAIADQFVADKQKFKIVIWAPFASISLICLVLAALLPIEWSLTALGTFFTHAIFCSGDFGLLSYLINHSDKDIYTYDDAESKITYFFERTTTDF